MNFKKFYRKNKDRVFGNTQQTALYAQQMDMADARLGISYFLSNIEMRKQFKNPLDLTGTFGSFVVDTTALSDLKSGCNWILENTDAGAKAAAKLQSAKASFDNTKVGKGLTKAGEKIDMVKTKIKQMLANFFNKLTSKLKTVFGESLEGMSWLSEFGIWAASSFTEGLADLIPGWGYFQAAADIYAGVSKAVVSGWHLVQQVWSGYGVELLGGHPSAIASALARHSALGIASGVKGVALGITNIGLEAAGDAAGGAGVIVTAVTGVIERVVGLIDYIIQRVRVNKVIKQAKDAWDNRNSAGSLVSDHKRFSEWFQNAVVCTPIVAALVMGSGYAAHPQRFLQLIDNRANASGPYAAIDQKAYDKGVHHIETLKKLSKGYVQDYTDSYSIKFTSTDKVIDKRLDELMGGKSLLEDYEYTFAANTAPVIPPPPPLTPSALGIDPVKLIKKKDSTAFKNGVVV